MFDFRKLFRRPAANARTAAASCPHRDFNVYSRFNRFADTGGTLCELKIECADCGKPFQWMGLEPGIDFQGARVSLDGLEAKIAIVPQGARPTPGDRMTLNLRRHDA